MATPYRVKRGGKYIGSFLVVVDGKRINLDTKDATEARARARLAGKGLWPPADKVAADVRGVMESGETPPPVLEIDEESFLGNLPPVETVPSKGATVETSTHPPAAPIVEPEPVDPVAAANAAAVDVSAEGEDVTAGAAAALADAGVDLSAIEADLPKYLSGIHLWAQGQAARAGVRVAKGKWPALVTLPEDDGLRLMIGKLWKAKLAEWDLHPERITPGWWLVILSGVTVAMQTATMLAELSEAEKAEGTGDAGAA